MHSTSTSREEVLDVSSGWKHIRQRSGQATMKRQVVRASDKQKKYIGTSLSAVGGWRKRCRTSASRKYDAEENLRLSKWGIEMSIRDRKWILSSHHQARRLPFSRTLAGGGVHMKPEVHKRDLENVRRTTRMTRVFTGSSTHSSELSLAVLHARHHRQERHSSDMVSYIRLTSRWMNREGEDLRRANGTRKRCLRGSC